MGCHSMVLSVLLLGIVIEIVLKVRKVDSIRKSKAYPLPPPVLHRRREHDSPYKIPPTPRNVALL